MELKMPLQTPKFAYISFKVYTIIGLYDRQDYIIIFFFLIRPLRGN